MQWLEKFFLRLREFLWWLEKLWQWLRGVWQRRRKLPQRLPELWQWLPDAWEWLPALQLGTSLFERLGCGMCRRRRRIVRDGCLGRTGFAIPSATFCACAGHWVHAQNVSDGFTKPVAPISISRPASVRGRSRMGKRQSRLPTDQATSLDDIRLAPSRLEILMLLPILLQKYLHVYHADAMHDLNANIYGQDQFSN